MRWPKFTIRSLGIAIAIAAIVFAYIGAQWRGYQRRLFVLQQVEAIDGGYVLENDGGFQSLDLYTHHVVHRERHTFFQYLLGKQRRLEEIRLDGLDYVPARLLREIGQMPEVECLVVSPAVSRTTEVQSIREQNRIEVLIVERPDQFIEVIDSVESFYRTISRPNVVLFLDGEWSTSALITRRKFSLLADYWNGGTKLKLNAGSANQPVRFLRVDLTNANTPVWKALQTWQESQGLPKAALKAFGGVGRVFWIKDGKVVHYLPTLADVTNHDVFLRTNAEFAESAQE
jgi:hypothetical protein